MTLRIASPENVTERAGQVLGLLEKGLGYTVA